MCWERLVLQKSEPAKPSHEQVVSRYTGRLGVSTGISLLFMSGNWMYVVMYFRLWLEVDGDDVEKYPTVFPSTIYLHLACVFAAVAIAQVLAIARGMVARQPTSIVMVQIITMSGVSMGVVSLVAGVEKTITPHTQTDGMAQANYDLVMGTIMIVCYPLAYLNRQVIFGSLSSFFDHWAKITAAKALGQCFIPNERGRDYLSHRNNFRSPYTAVILDRDTASQTALTHARIGRSISSSSDLLCPLTPTSTLHPHTQLRSPVNAVYEDTQALLHEIYANHNAMQADAWWKPSTQTHFGATDYFVVAANSTNVRSAISTFVEKCGFRKNSPTLDLRMRDIIIYAIHDDDGRSSVAVACGCSVVQNVSSHMRGFARI